MDQYAHPIIEELMQIEANKKCFDCGNNHPKWASLNNGVFVCLKCAGLHRSFGVSVSFVRSLTIDSWQDKQIEILKRGGNQRFRDFLDEFKVPGNATMDFKYMIRASDYYRKLLKSEVEESEPPFKPDIISGLEMLDYGINSSANFDNSRPITSTPDQPKQKTGFFSSVSSFLAKTGETVKLTANRVGSKIKEMDIPDKLKHTGEKTLVFAKATGNFVVEKGKEVYNSEFVQNSAHKIEGGINILVDKTKKLLKREKHDKLFNEEVAFSPEQEQNIKANEENVQANEDIQNDSSAPKRV